MEQESLSTHRIQAFSVGVLISSNAGKVSSSIFLNENAFKSLFYDAFVYSIARGRRIHCQIEYQSVTRENLDVYDV